jgi:hypothetical protein
MALPSNLPTTAPQSWSDLRRYPCSARVLAQFQAVPVGSAASSRSRRGTGISILSSGRWLMLLDRTSRRYLLTLRCLRWPFGIWWTPRASFRLTLISRHTLGRSRQASAGLIASSARSAAAQLFELPRSRLSGG